MERLTGEVQHYEWGSREEIPQILGRRPDGTPWAEYWLGAHPKAPSTLENGETLDVRLAEDPDELGRASRQRFGDRLPFLLKILSADHSLSIQAHPSREQAEIGFAAENAAGVALHDPTRLFLDDWPKPEMLVALTDFDALCGFRDPATSLLLLSGLGPVDGLDNLLNPLREDSDGLATVLKRVFDGSDEVRGIVRAVVEAARRRIAEGGDEEVLGLARTAVELDADHPGDPSILVALLMNRVRLAPGQQIHLGAGTMHAYLGGTGIEIMANSDNVLRGGLTNKHIDVDALLSHAVLHPEPCVGEQPQPDGPGRAVYTTPFPEFRLWALSGPSRLPATGLGRILLVVSGALELHHGDDILTLSSGQAAWLPAGEEIEVVGSGQGYLAAAAV